MDSNAKHVVGDFGQKALVVKYGKVLMCKGVGWHTWDFPGGRLHVGEDLKEGLRRELKEELGVDVEVGEPFFITVWYGAPSGMPRVMAVYHSALVDPAQEFILEKEEIEAIHWVGKDDDWSLVSEEWIPALEKFFAK